MRDRSSGVVSRWPLPRWLTLPALFTLTAVAAGACSGSGNAGLTALGTCVTSANCGADQECSANLCVNLVRCETAATCPLGQNCVDQVCRATCTSDDQCAPLKLSCDHASGVCLPAPSVSGTAGSGSASAGAGGTDTGGSNAGGAAGDTSTLGGATASGGSSVASASSDGGGAAGSAGMGGTGAVSAPPLETLDMIDDLEDGDTTIIATNGRSGQWYFYNPSGNNSAGDIQQSIDPTFAGANSSKYSIETKGGPLPGDGSGYAGLALDFDNQGNTPTDPSRKPYDASGWDGISFWAKGNLPNESVRVELATVEIAAPEQGGSCTNSCYDWYGKPVVLTGEWSKYEVPFTALTQAGWGSKQPLDLVAALGINFKYETASSSFDFAIDEVAFYRAGTSTPTNTGGSGGSCAAPGAPCR